MFDSLLHNYKNSGSFLYRMLKDRISLVVLSYLLS
jgi:hypothetical protein